MKYLIWGDPPAKPITTIKEFTAIANKKRYAKDKTKAGKTKAGKTADGREHKKNPFMYRK